MAQFERSRLKQFQDGPKISFRRVRGSVFNYPALMHVKLMKSNLP